MAGVFQATNLQENRWWGKNSFKLLLVNFVGIVSGNLPDDKKCANAKTERIYRVKGFWGVFRSGRKVRYRFFAYQDVVYLYFFSNPGVPGDSVYDPCVLDQY
jgi:hypothetical protein